MKTGKRVVLKFRCERAEGKTWCRYCMCHVGKVRSCYGRSAYLDPSVSRELLRQVQQ